MPFVRGVATCQQQDSNRIDALLRKCKKYGYTAEDLKFSDILIKADRDLFRRIHSPAHCIHFLLPERKAGGLATRPRGQDFQLP